MLAQVMKRKAVGTVAALAPVVAGVLALPAAPAAAAGYFRYFKLPNGDIAICRYSDSGQWLGCTIVGPAR
jgi:hypothetical protein